MILKVFDIVDKFCRWFDRRFLLCWDDIPSDLRVCWDNIERIINFIPILWRDWDFNFSNGMFELIKKKLERLEPCLLRHINADRDRRRIRTCINLLDKIINCDYEEKFHKKHNIKWGKPKMNWINFREKDNTYQLLIKRKNVNTPEERKQERREYNIGCEHAEKQHQQAIDYVFKLMAKHGRTWWD